jgi:hypothetical protein
MPVNRHDLAARYGKHEVIVTFKPKLKCKAWGQKRRSFVVAKIDRHFYRRIIQNPTAMAGPPPTTMQSTAPTLEKFMIKILTYFCPGCCRCNYL